LVLVAALGAAVGIGELASRYRDEPAKAILSVPATIYVLLNATAAILALVLGRHFDWLPTAEEPIAWSQVLAAGLGAMVILRSSVFQVRVDDHQDVAVGPSSFLESVMAACDRAVDRLRAQERAWAVARVMEGVSSEKAMTILPAYISALMQNLNPNEQGDFESRIEKIRSGKQTDQVKALTLGLLAMNYIGEKVLTAAVQSLAAEIRLAAATTADAAAQAAFTARDSKTAAEKMVAAMKGVITQATQTTITPPEVRQAVEGAKEMAAAAETTAQETLDATQKTAEAAHGTVEKLTQVTQTTSTPPKVRQAEGAKEMAEVAETTAQEIPDATQKTAEAANGTVEKLTKTA
jgi:methyl-accepting chemotaxis protein